MIFKVGDCLLEVIFKIMIVDGLGEMIVSDLIVGKIFVLFGVLGVFILICYMNYLLGFVEYVEIFKGKGVDQIVVLFVNDVFVMDVWEKVFNISGNIIFFVDIVVEFVEVVGFGFGLVLIFGYLCLQCFVLIVKDGEIIFLVIEDSLGEVIKIGVVVILEVLG